MKVVIIGDYNPDYLPHPATTKSLEHVAKKNNLDIQIEWIDTDKLNEPFKKQFERAGSIWLAPSPYKNKNQVQKALTYIRNYNIPFIGTCGGLYQAISEFFLTQLKYKEDLIEITTGDKSDSLFLRDSSCTLHGFNVIQFKTVKNTKVHSIYSTEACEEDSNCGFAVNSKYHSILALHDFIISGIDENNEAKIFELTSNKFYVVTKFLPQMRTTFESPHPLVEAFVKAGL